MNIFEEAFSLDDWRNNWDKEEKINEEFSFVEELDEDDLALNFSDDSFEEERELEEGAALTAATVSAAAKFVANHWDDILKGLKDLGVAVDDVDENIVNIIKRHQDVKKAEELADPGSPVDESLVEDTEKKSNGKWVNKGEDGEHGEFKTKKEADAQRKAMFANGFSEELDEDDLELESIISETLLKEVSNNTKPSESIVENDSIVNEDVIRHIPVTQEDIQKIIDDHYESLERVRDASKKSEEDDDMDFSALVAKKYAENPSRVGGENISEELKDVAEEQASNAVDEFEDDLDEEDLFASIASGIQKEE